MRVDVRVDRSRNNWSVVLMLVALLGGLACDATDRAGRLAQAGEALGLRARGDVAQADQAVLREMPSLKARPQNFLTNALESEELIVFDWTWRKGPLKEKNREAQSVVAVRVPGGDLPTFVWVGRGQIAGPAAVRLGGAIEFPDGPEFSDRNTVLGPDRRAVRALFTHERRRGLALPPGWRVEGRGEWLIGYRPSELLAPAEIEDAIETFRAVARLLQSPSS